MNSSAEIDLPKLSIVLVNYNTPDLTIACIKSIHNYPPSGEFEVLVVDNASSDNSVERISQSCPQCIIIPSNVNLGFSKGNNLALRRAKHEILLLLNSDTEVHENSLTRLQSFLVEHPKAAVVGGKHYKTDGSVQRTIKYYPRVRNKWSEALFLHFLFNGKSFTEHEKRLKHYNEPTQAEWLSGSYLAVKREWYDLVGGLDSGFFMYSEDIDWCYRIHKAGGTLWYIPDSTITHHCGGSSKGENNLSTELIRAHDRYARLHMGKLRSFLFRLGTAVFLLNRLTIFTLLGVFDSSNKVFASQRWNALIALYKNPLPIHPTDPSI